LSNFIKAKHDIDHADVTLWAEVNDREGAVKDKKSADYADFSAPGLCHLSLKTNCFRRKAPSLYGLNRCSKAKSCTLKNLRNQRNLRIN